MTLEFYTSVAKGLKLSPTFVEVTGETLVGVAFLAPSSWIGLMLQLHCWNNDIIGVEIISTKHIFFLVSNLTGINGVILVISVLNYKQISHMLLVFSLMTSNKEMPVGLLATLEL